MANRRMFSLDVVNADKFLEMPASSQSLYFHLGMRADDDGFVSSPKSITRTVGSGIDDLKILISKGYVIPFENGIVVIADWAINNWIRPDRKHDTRFPELLKRLNIENGVYKVSIGHQPNNNQLTTVCQSSGCQPTAICHTEDRLGKDSIDKDNINTFTHNVDLVENANCDFSSVENSDFGEVKNKGVEKRRVNNSSVENLAPNNNSIKSNSINNNNSLNTSMQIPDNRTGISMILKDGSFYEVVPDKAAMWQRAYPGLDVECELYQMAAWCDSNPAKRKTRTGIEKFINGWLNRSQNGTQYPKQKKEAENDGSDKPYYPESFEEYL